MIKIKYLLLVGLGVVSAGVDVYAGTTYGGGDTRWNDVVSSGSGDSNLVGFKHDAIWHMHMFSTHEDVFHISLYSDYDVNNDTGNVLGRIRGESTKDWFGLMDKTNDWALKIKTDDFISFGVGGDTKMSILNSGNVGIGTDSPASTLHLHKDRGTPILRIEAVNPTTDEQEPSIELMSYDMVGNLQKWHLRVDQSDSGALTFRSEINGGSAITAFMIEPSGNVGIGTVNPSAQLHVTGTAKFDGEVTIASIPAQGDISMGPFAN